MRLRLRDEMVRWVALRTAKVQSHKLVRERSFGEGWRDRVPEKVEYLADVIP